jgi:hypothetical protein
MKIPYTTMPRDAAEFFWGQKIPPEVAYYKLYPYEGKEAVTWKDVHSERSKRQQGNLFRKRYQERQRMAAMLKVNSKDWTCGYAYCKVNKGRYWIDYRNPNKQQLCEYLQNNIPFGELIFSFKDWKNLFERKIGSLPVFIEVYGDDVIAIEIYKRIIKG